MHRLITLLLSFILAFGPAFAQKDDAKVTIRVNGKEKDIEEYFQEWGENFERDMERLARNFDGVQVNIDDNDINIEIDDFSESIELFSETLAETITKAVTNMNIELTDIDPEDIYYDDVDFDCDVNLRRVLRDIEDKHDSDVDNIDRMLIKIREDYVLIDMDVSLENGKEVSYKRVIDDE